MPPNLNLVIPYSISFNNEKKDGFKCDSFLIGMFENIASYFKAGQFCDVTLIADDGWRVEAHQVLLSAASKYFLSIFADYCPGTDAREVHLKEINGHTLTLIINFIYTGSIDVAAYTLHDYLKAARLFESKLLEEMCYSYMSTQIDTSNCLDILILAEKFNYKVLYETCRRFVCQNFKNVSQEDMFFLLHPTQLNKFLSSDELCVNSEEDVFTSLLSWVKYDQAQREQCFGMLLHNVRFPFLFPKFISNAVESACNCVESQKLIYKALKWHLMPDCRASLFPKEQTQLRNWKDMVIAISGWREESLKVGVYIPAVEKWIYRDWPGLPELRVSFASTIVNQKLIIAGGILPSGMATNRVDCLDLRTLNWTQLSPLQTPRHTFKLVTLMGRVYAIGGHSTESCNDLNSVEMLDQLESQWKYLPPMPKESKILHAAIFLNSIWVVTSTKDNKKQRPIVYDTVTEKWTNRVATAQNIIGMGMIRDASSDYFIILRRTSIKKYDLEPELISISPITFDYHSCVVSANRFIVYGKNEFKEFNPLQNEWKPLPSLENDFTDLIVFAN